MPKLKYALERGGDKSLEISWKGRFKNTEVRLKGNLIGVIPNKKVLRTGQIFQLPDGTSLKVQFVKSELRVLRNDKPLPGSISDPVTRLAQAFGIIYFIAGLNIVLGFIALFFHVEFLQTLGFGIISVAIGIIFLLLGFFTQRRSLIALMVALIIYGLDCALALFSVVPFLLSVVSMAATVFNIDVHPALRPQAGEFLQVNAVFIGILTFTIILRLYFLWAMWQGVGAINALKKESPPIV
ncbi:MAG TPA: hypothetical protein VFI68_03750 [Anaerolineales bacterium]|nr:hypothetical protein [Anaerolineales bacterium]